MNIISHDNIVSLLGRLNSTMEASEVHGLLCGLLCSSPSSRAKARWFSELLDSTGLAAEGFSDHTSDLKSLEELFDGGVSDLNAADFSFQLLLPDDTESVTARTDSLASWCSGFSVGIGLGVGTKGQRSPELPEDTRELLRDFEAISKAAVVDESVIEESQVEGTDEEALLELQEYVRMGVLLINEELAPVEKPPQQVH